MIKERAVAAAAALLVSAASPAPAFELQFPLACELGVDCWLQQLVDRDPGPDALDHACGPHAYDGHKGVDIRLADDAALGAEVAVLAPAAGTVIGVRDGVPDGEFPAGKDCGNGVAIDHGDGWRTQLCHLRNGSIAVEQGREVQAGDVLGAVGLSGNTEFPHLHVTLRRGDAVVDPFDGRPADAPCGAGGASLWAPEAGLPDVPGGVHGLGLRAAPPEFEAARAGLPQARVLPARGPSLVAWAMFHATEAGDRIEMSVSGPDGEVASREVIADRPQAERFLTIGRRSPAEGWPPGRYEAFVRMERDGRVLGERRIAAQVR
ncbi:MAG: M23 family metallopeptidase [Pseudomonadota bacterium]